MASFQNASNRSWAVEHEMSQGSRRTLCWWRAESGSRAKGIGNSYQQGLDLSSTGH